jgi:hypothetical protein
LIELHSVPSQPGPDCGISIWRRIVSGHLMPERLRPTHARFAPPDLGGDVVAVNRPRIPSEMAETFSELAPVAFSSGPDLRQELGRRSAKQLLTKLEISFGFRHELKSNSVSKKPL